MKFFAIAAAVAFSTATLAMADTPRDSGKAPPPSSCSASVGAKQAEIYVQQCLQVSPATHPPCNATNPCKLILDEIRRGCQFITENAPEFCKTVDNAPHQST